MSCIGNGKMVGLKLEGEKDLKWVDLDCEEDWGDLNCNLEGSGEASVSLGNDEDGYTKVVAAFEDADGEECEISLEALREMIDYCFNVKGFITLWSDFFVDNPASGRVMEKCGFIDTGHQVLCPGLEIGGDKPAKVMRLDYAN
mgnify:CR=1 FL=1